MLPAMWDNKFWHYNIQEYSTYNISNIYRIYNIMSVDFRQSINTNNLNINFLGIK